MDAHRHSEYELRIARLEQLLDEHVASGHARPSGWTSPPASRNFHVNEPNKDACQLCGLVGKYHGVVRCPVGRTYE